MTVQILTGDCREILPTLDAGSVQCCVTSPPYFQLRDYQVAGQIGLETSIEEYVAALVEVFGEVRRVLRDDGVLWCNLGDSYFGTGKGPTPPTGMHGANGTPYPTKGLYTHGTLKQKDLIGLPWRVAFALQADGWWLRSDCIWSKPNPMPESVRDRPTKAHEYVFLLTKSASYFYDADAVAEPVTHSTIARVSQPNLAQQAGSYRVPGKTNGPMKAVVRATGQAGGAYSPPGQTAHSNARKQDGHGRRHAGFNERYFAEEQALTRNLRTVWTIATRPFKEAHFATFPPDLAEICIKSGSRPGDTVLDPFGGAGTTGLVADRLGRNAVLLELNPDYAEMARRRITNDAPLLATVEGAA